MKKYLMLTALAGTLALTACVPCDNYGEINGWPDKAPAAYCCGKQAEKKQAAKPAQKQQPKKASEGVERLRRQNTAPLAVGTAIVLDSYSFDTNSTYLGKDSRDYLAEKAEELKGVKYNRLVITGHADSSGNADANQKLSERRAQAVGDYLISEGVPAKKIVVVGKGSSEPIATNATAEGRRQNRRVHIAVE